jgi:Domain of unknown function (DUF6285)
MNDRPTPLELIRIANDTLTTQVLPGAQPQQLYALRMIASALGIAARELAAHDKDATDETRGLNLLRNDSDNDGDSGSKIPGDLVTRNRQLARDIRAGMFEDGGAREAQLRQHLIVTARRKLAAAYPKGLDTSNK